MSRPRSSGPGCGPRSGRRRAADALLRSFTEWIDPAGPHRAVPAARRRGRNSRTAAPGLRGDPRPSGYLGRGRPRSSAGRHSRSTESATPFARRPSCSSVFIANLLRWPWRPRGRAKRRWMSGIDWIGSVVVAARTTAVWRCRPRPTSVVQFTEFEGSRPCRPRRRPGSRPARKRSMQPSHFTATAPIRSARRRAGSR